jgi:hypothetical protein
MNLLFRESCRPNHSGLAKPTRTLLCYSWAQEWSGQLLEILAAADIVFVYFVESQLSGLTVMDEIIAIAKLATERLIWRKLFRRGYIEELGKGALVVKAFEDKNETLKAAGSGQAISSSQDLSAKELWKETEHLDDKVHDALYWDSPDDLRWAIQPWIES